MVCAAQHRLHLEGVRVPRPKACDLSRASGCTAKSNQMLLCTLIESTDQSTLMFIEEMLWVIWNPWSCPKRSIKKGTLKGSEFKGKRQACYIRFSLEAVPEVPLPLLLLSVPSSRVPP